MECVVIVERDEFPPQFINTPYAVTITELSANNSAIYTITATDQDLKVIIALFLYETQTFCNKKDILFQVTLSATHLF